jgi:membrane-associated phospholipid phosphatase
MEVVRALQQFASPGLDQVMLLITNLGSESAYTLLLTVTYLGIDARAGRRIGIYFLASFYLNELLKGAFDTLRPFEIDATVARSDEAVATALGPGFPSGHAQGSTTFWGLAALYAQRWWFLVVAALVVVLVAFSRIYLGLHLPIDVLGGVLIGAAIVTLGAAIDRLDLEPQLWLLLILGVGVPFALHLALPTADSDTILGTLAAFLIGPSLYRHSTDGGIPGRIVVTLIGLAVAFGYILGTSALLPEEVKDHQLWGFLRYLVAGLLAVILVPWFGRATGLTPERTRA